MRVDETWTLHIEDLSKSYGDFFAVRDVSFTAAPGRITALLGLNGAGKSTLLASVLGLVSHTGRVSFGPLSHAELVRREVGAIGWVMQPMLLPRDLSVRGFAKAVAHLKGDRSDSMWRDVIPTGYDHSARLGKLSVGMRQRLALRAAMLGAPRFLLLDEPTNGLDALQRKAIISMIRAVADRGATVLVTSHIMDDIDNLADDVVVIDDGVTLAASSKTDFIGRWGSSSLLVRAREIDALLLDLTSRGFVVEERSPSGAKVSGGSAEVVGTVAAGHGHVITELTPVGRSLEAAFWNVLQLDATERAPS